MALVKLGSAIKNTRTSSDFFTLNYIRKLADDVGVPNSLGSNKIMYVWHANKGWDYYEFKIGTKVIVYGKGLGMKDGDLAKGIIDRIVMKDKNGNVVVDIKNINMPAKVAGYNGFSGTYFEEIAYKGDDTFISTKHSQKMKAYGGNDKMFGNGGNDILVGGSHSDILKGGAGIDKLYGDDQNFNDWITKYGNDKLYGGKGNDELRGGDGKDMLYGEAGRDTLRGDEGKDNLTGGAGQDKLWGGSGPDHFVFAKLTDSTVKTAGRDTIEDFRSAQGDKINLKAIDADATRPGNQAFDFIGDDRFSRDAGELRFQKQGGATLVTGDRNGDGRPDFAILVDGHIAFKSNDFIL